MKKIKKIKRKWKKRIHNFLSTHPHELGITNYLYIFFVVISLLYGILIFSLGTRYGHESETAAVHQEPNVLENKLSKMTESYPINGMTPIIARKDKKVAAYLMAIAKKESNWGKLSPKKEGRECWNFWGYRGSENPTASGYSCFDSPKEAVMVVGGRIEDLIQKNYDSPKEMSVWKCGYDCSWDNPTQVNKWISDVGYYYRKIYE